MFFFKVTPDPATLIQPGFNLDSANIQPPQFRKTNHHPPRSYPPFFTSPHSSRVNAYYFYPKPYNMKRLSISLPALSFVLAFLSLTAIAWSNTHAAHPAKAAYPAKTARDITYYWYNTSDNYVGYNTLSAEEFRLEGIYGVPVDDNSAGGTLLEKGYVNFGTPHMGFADEILSAHYY